MDSQQSNVNDCLKFTIFPDRLFISLNDVPFALWTN